MRRGKGAPLDGNWQLPRPRDGLDDDVGLFDAAGQQLGLCALEEGLDDGVVPAGVDDAHAQGAAVVDLGRWSLGFGVHFERRGLWLG